jgi:hypothetical protein
METSPLLSLQYLYSLGVPEKWQIVDVYGLDPELLATVPRPVLAVVLLFPYSDKVCGLMLHRNFMFKRLPSVISGGDVVVWCYPLQKISRLIISYNICWGHAVACSHYATSRKTTG